MVPEAFAAFTRELAAKNDFPPEQLLLGGDHLGPSPWQEDPAELAMSRAADMVRSYVRAGFTKIHLDASMTLGDDEPSRPLSLEVAARRTAILARAAEDTRAKFPNLRNDLRYVIGTEVPIPGGATIHEKSVQLTTVEDARRTLEVTQAAFGKAGLESAWERVVAMVVQPGVEFGSDFVLDYDPEAASSLARFAETIPMVYEAHSTDYQVRDNLKSLVADHFAFLKVGPALTFAFREAVFSLAKIEAELVEEDQRSHLIETLEAVMLGDPRHWQKHYHGTSQELALARKFSLSDRIRYYWPNPTVHTALKKLLKNLDALDMPLSLLSQYSPDAYRAIRSGELQNSANEIILHQIRSVLNDYSIACSKMRS